MSGYKVFEELDIWKKGREIVNDVYVLTEKPGFARDFALKNQIRDAAISIVSNIAEGFERDGDNENIRFLYYAKGSAGEVREQLYLSKDRKYAAENEFKMLYEKLTEEGRMVSGMIRYLGGKGYKGRKKRS